MLRRLASAGSRSQQADWTVVAPILGNNHSQLFSSSTPSPAPAENKIEVTVDGKSVEIEKGMTVMQACDIAGKEIPRFCYHQRLSIAGNCRMCLVEVEKAAKPVASCAMPAMPNMVIKTDTPLVRKAREGVMEFLLANHPLDCPICDQGGECDLQDQSLQFGSDRSRFSEVKRTVVDKNVGPLVKMIMTRCIHCTRCVRFAKEVAGIEDLGMTGRGRDSEITTYVSKLMESELSGNVTDICPVGALTAKPNAFTYRQWELKSTESIDVHDAIGSNIRVDTKGTEVIRIMPTLHEGINEEWISDKTRFANDGLKHQRLSVPMVRNESGQLQPCDWEEALVAAATALGSASGNEIGAVAGKLADLESMTGLKDLLGSFGSDRMQAEGGSPTMSADLRSDYILNSTVEALEFADTILMVGCNMRTESPVVNARLRRAAVSGVPVAYIGPKMDLTYPSIHLGEDPSVLNNLLNGETEFLKEMQGSAKPAIIVGNSVFERPDSSAIKAALMSLVESTNAVTPEWNGYNVMHTAAARVGALDIGFLPGPQASSLGKDAPLKVLYLLGSDEISVSDIPQDTTVIYQGHHGDVGASLADIILPGTAYTEKSCTYVNAEGRVQRTKKALSGPGAAREDWKIIRALSEYVEKPLPYSTVEELRARMKEYAPHLGTLDRIEPATWVMEKQPSESSSPISNSPLKYAIDDFYMTDSISRASKTMARISRAKKENLDEAFSNNKSRELSPDEQASLAAALDRAYERKRAEARISLSL